MAFIGWHYNTDLDKHHLKPVACMKIQTVTLLWIVVERGTAVRLHFHPTSCILCEIALVNVATRPRQENTHVLDVFPCAGQKDSL